MKKLREDGDRIALLYHATGTGKTVTVVEDAKAVGGRTLFLAHTKELIEQGKNIFENLWTEASCGTLMGDIKEKEAQVICASVQSINNNLEEFDIEDFKYIIIDGSP